jgi:hypothetical protein
VEPGGGKEEAASILAVSLADRLLDEIRGARDWADLENALNRAQDAFEAGELLGEEVEDLAVQAAQEAQIIPERPDR